MDENVKRVNKMAKDIDAFYKGKKDHMVERDRTVAKRDRKMKQLIEQ